MSRCTVDGCGRPHCARGLCRLHYYRSKRIGETGPAGLMVAEKGAGTLTRHGYRSIGGGANRRLEHVLIAERAIGGPLPPGAQVHHVNEVKSDNRPSNLVVCPDAAYHSLLHARTRAFDACGNASWRPCSLCKKYDDPSRMGSAGRPGKFRHRECYAAYQRARKAPCLTPAHKGVS